MDTEFKPTESQYQQKFDWLRTNRQTTINWAYPVVTSHQTIDTWQLAVKNIQPRSARVEKKLNALWSNQDYLGLAYLMQFTPKKYSCPRLAPLPEIKNGQVVLADELSAEIYQHADAQKIKHILIYFHGGGLLNGSSNRVADFLQYCCQQLGPTWAIISIDYPYVSEIGLSMLITTCQQAIIDINYKFKASEMFLAGDSSGAFLISQLQALIDGTNKQSNIAGQILIYPQLEIATISNSQIEKMTPINNTLRQLYQDFAQLINIQTAIVGTQKQQLPLVACPTLIIQAQHDIFNYQVATLLEQLPQKSSQQLQIGTFAGMLHGFIDYFGYLPQAQLAADEIVLWLQQQLE